MKALFALNPYLWRYKGHLILGILFVAASNILAIYPAQIVRSAIDMVGDMLRLYELYQGFAIEAFLNSFLFQTLVLFASLVLGAAVFRGVFLFLTRQTLIAMSRRIEYDIRNDIYDHFQNLSLSFYRKNRTGDLMARIAEDVGRVRMYLGPGIMYTLNTITLFVVIVSTMLVVNAELTLYALLPLPFLSYLIYRVESIIQQRSEKIQEQLSTITTFTQEVFSGIRVIKAYVKEKASAVKFTEETEDYKQKSLRLARVDALFFPLVVFLVGMSVVLTMFVGGRKVIAGNLTIGNIAEFIMYINLLTWPIIAIGWVTTLIQRAAASQKRLNELLAQESEIKFIDSSHQVKEASIAFKDVSFTYPDTGIKGLENVSFSLKPGQKLGILGPTGAGKSTLCALIPRCFDPDFGEIVLDGISLKQYSKSSLRSAIGYAPQDVFLFSETLKGNIAFGRQEATLEEVREAARWAQIDESIMGFPEQYDTLVGERGVTLSGGQKQRTAIARAWVRKPKLLILDDVLSAVDMQTEDAILTQLKHHRQENPEVALIMVAHRISCLQDADTILVLENGKVTERGTHAALLEQKGYYARIFEKQMMENQMTTS
ncbi:MAG: ABC transporter ATP-binding protein [Bacteroidota bacterium]